MITINMKTKVLFFRGLNTYGVDHLRLGPIPLTSMTEHFAKALAAEASEFAINFEPILSLGSGTLDEIVGRFCLNRVDLLNDKSNFILIGHSAGGLIARAISHHPDWRERVQAVITIACPHHGAPAATSALKLLHKQNWKTRTLRRMGYDLKPRERIFADLTEASMRVFNLKFPDRGSPLYSVVCQIPLGDRSPALGFWSPPTAFEGDGFIPTKSQEFGITVGPFACDHLDAMGVHWHVRRHRRVQARQEFLNMIKNIVQIIRKSMHATDKKI